MSRELEEGSGSDDQLKKRLKKQRDDISKIFKKVKDLADKKSEDNIDKTIDKGSILSRSAKGLALLFGTNPTPWEIMFPLEYYHQIYRLNNWDDSGDKIYHRPGIVGTWTNWLVYIKFPEGTIKWLREQRIISSGNSGSIRFHQFATPDGKQKIMDYINNVIILMSICSTWDEFKRTLAKTYGKVYQPNMFDQDLIEWKPVQ